MLPSIDTHRREEQEKTFTFAPQLNANSMVLAEERDLRKDLWTNTLAAEVREGAVMIQL